MPRNVDTRSCHESCCGDKYDDGKKWAARTIAAPTVRQHRKPRAQRLDAAAGVARSVSRRRGRSLGAYNTDLFLQVPASQRRLASIGGTRLANVNETCNHIPRVDDPHSLTVQMWTRPNSTPKNTASQSDFASAKGY